MDSLLLFGLFAVIAMMVCYALESCSHWFVLAFPGTCCPGIDLSFLQGAGRLPLLVAGDVVGLVARIAEVRSHATGAKVP
jgi:hypothetical protein